MRAPANAPAISAARHARTLIQPVSWTQLPGAMTFVAASPDGTLWGLGTGSGDRPIYHYVSGSWVYAQGAASRLAVGPDGTPWAVTAPGGIYSYQNGSWNAIAGGATDITVGADGSVYVISNQGGGQYGFGIWHDVGGSWSQLPGAGVRIAASWDTGTYAGGIAPGGFYVLNALGSIYYYTVATGFIQQPGTASAIAPTANGGYFTLSFPADPTNGNPIIYTDLGSGTSSTQPGAGFVVSTSNSFAYVIGRANGVYQSGISVAGTVVWKTGGGNLGQYVLPVPGDGQCAGVGPVISGSNATFTMLRNTNGTYNYHNRNFSGASTCWRNQMNPIDPNTGTNVLLNVGAHYTFTFQTVVTFNGNYLYQGATDGGIAVDVPAIVWQTHSYGGDGEPCDALVIDNTYVAYANGLTQYGTVPQGGLPTWNFHTCDEETDFTAPAYNSPDTLHDGEVDNWQIDLTAQIQNQPGGSVVMRRNGIIVYNAPTHMCDPSTTQCFWNFGPYMFFWENTEEPPGWNNAGVTIQMNNMTLLKQ